MAPLFVAALVVVCIVLVSFLLMKINENEKQKIMNKLIDRFNRVSAKHHLDFSSKEILKNHILGFDSSQRVLLLVNSNEDGERPYVLIDLEAITNCSIKKQYGSIRSGELKKVGLEQYLQNISIHIGLEGNKEPMQILFYSQLQNSLSEAKGLEERARLWKTLLTKFPVPAENRA